MIRRPARRHARQSGCLHSFSVSKLTLTCRTGAVNHERVLMFNVVRDDLRAKLIESEVDLLLKLAMVAMA